MIEVIVLKNIKEPQINLYLEDTLNRKTMKHNYFKQNSKALPHLWEVLFMLFEGLSAGQQSYAFTSRGQPWAQTRWLHPKRRLEW